MSYTSDMRQNAEQEKERAARLSIFASGGLALLKLIAGLLSGSLALLSEAVHGLIDLCATIMTWFAIREGAKPADDEHHYGHGKIEAVAALAETGLLIVLAAGVGIEAIRRLLGHGNVEIEATGIAIAVILFSMCVDFIRWRHLSKIAKKTSSAALAADALHFSTDLFSSAAILTGLVAVAAGFAWGDTIAALVVALFIAVAGWRLGRRTIDTLVDTAPRGVVDTIRKSLQEVRGISEVQSIRVRSVGPVLYAEVAVLVPRILAFERVSSIKAEALRVISQALPECEATVTAEPATYDNETILERVLLIAAKRRVPVHHVTVQELSGRLSVSLDVEVDGRMSLAAAHQIASKLEHAIQEELGPDTEVETHIEPLEAQGLLGRDADAETVSQITSTIKNLEQNIEGIGDVHSIRVRETDRGLIVTLHALAEPEQTVENVHAAVDELERQMRIACPQVLRIVSHAEPKR